MSYKLFQRGSVWYYRGTIAGRRVCKTTRTKDKTVAQRIADEAAARAWRRHLDGPQAEVTFADAAIGYREAGKSTRFLEKIEDHWRDTRLRDIKTGAIRQSASRLYPDATAATRNRQVIVLTMAIINHAASLGWCSKIKVDRFKGLAKRKEPADLPWVKAFAAHAQPHLGALCIFMFGTGARKGEAVRLTWKDLDLDARTAKLSDNKPEPWERVAHLPPYVVAALTSWPSNRNPDDPVFQYLDAQNVKQSWDAVVERAGIKRLTPHSCRHGFATSMLRAGHDVATVAKAGGWKDPATVLRYYAHANEDRSVTNVLFDTELTQPASKDTVTSDNQRRKKP